MFRFATSSVLAMACASISISAKAQAPSKDSVPPSVAPAADGVEEITVTAQRRSENIDRVPLSVTALSAERLTKSNIISTSDLGLVTPGLNFTAATGYAAPFLRGVGNNSATPGSESAIATYVDGVYYGSPSSTVFSLAGISQIEVLKGPQGTLFGRNATGGVIQIRTLDPKDELSGSLSVGYGNYDTFEAKGYLTGGLAEGLAASLAGYIQNQGDGYGRNVTTGNDTNRQNSLALHGKIKWALGPDTMATLAADYSKVKTSIGVAWRPYPGALTVLGTRFPAGLEDLTSDIDPYINDRQGGVSLTLKHDFDKFSLLSITAYRREKLYQDIDIDYGLPLSLLGAYGPTKIEQESQELQIQSAAGANPSWTGGVYLYRNSSKYDPFHVYGAVLAPLDYLEITSEQVARSAAVFGQLTYDFGAGTHLTAGARYTIEERKLDEQETATLVDGSSLGTIAADNGRKTFRSPTWRIALDHEFQPGVMAYVSYNRGFKSGQFNSGSFTGVSVKPERLDAYEAGVKAKLFNNMLRFNNSIFYYDYQDMQIPSYNGVVLTLRNAARSRIYGWDSDFELVPMQGLRLTGGVEILRAKYRDFPNAAISSPLAAGGNSISSGSASGNRVMLAPKAMAFASADWRLPIPAVNIDANVTYSYNDGWFPDPDNRLHQNGFSQLGASLTWTSSDDRFSVTVWGRNLTDEIFAQWSSSSPAFTDVYSASAPRTFGARIGVKY